MTSVVSLKWGGGREGRNASRTAYYVNGGLDVVETHLDIHILI